MAITYNANTELKKIIGTGIKFPLSTPVTAPKNILLETVSGVDVIKQSIYLILSTRLGSRFNNPEFGSNLQTLLFEPLDGVLFQLIELYVTDAIRRWEKRITIQAVDITEQDEHTLLIKINFIINKTRSLGSYVYPFVRNPMPESSLILGKASIGFINF